MHWFVHSQLPDIYRRAFQWIQPDVGKIAAAGIISLILGLTSGLATFSFLPVFDIIFTKGGESSLNNQLGTSGLWGGVNEVLQWVAGDGEQLTRLARLLGFIVGLSLLSLALTLLADYLFVQVQARGTERLRKHVFEHLCNLPMQFYNKAKIGTLISRVENEIGGTVAMVAGSLADLVMNVFIVLALAVVLFVVHPGLTMVMVPVLIIVSASLIWLGRWIQHNRRRILELQGDIVALMQEFFGGMRIIKGFTAETFEQKRWNKAVVFWRRLEVINTLNKAVPARVAEFIALALSATILLVGGRLVIRNQMPLAELFLFFVILVRFQRPASSLSRVWLHIQDGAAYALRTEELLAEPTEPYGADSAPHSIKNAVAFESVDFSYGDDTVLKDILFTIRRGEVVALVGSSGSGKSTIADLLIRFYEPTRGRIRLDGIDISTLPIRPYRKLFGMVTQDTFLFHDTVRNNIAYALGESVSESNIVAAAQAAHAHDFISRLPKGYDTIIGDRGVRLSGGQRQRLAIARALIRNPQILILDEATSALDTKSERQVQEAIENLIRDRTTLVIAHRLSTIQKANRILVLHEGRIVERGTHQELLQQDGIYRHLWSLQSQ